MSYMLWQLLRDAYQELGQLLVAQATGGSTTTLVDSKLSGGRDDEWNGGTVILLEDAGGAGAAPEGEFARVTDYEDASGTLTIETLTAVPASGDLYGLASTVYPLHQMIELANLALKGLGDIPLVDTTLVTIGDQTEYTLAADWKRRPPFRVDIQTHSGDDDDHRWQRINWWEYVPATAGAAGLLVFDRQPEPTRKLRVWYLDGHPRVNAFDDLIYEGITPALAVSVVVEKALIWHLSRLDGQNDFLMQRLNDARNEAAQMKALYPLWMPPRQAKMRLAGR